MYTLNVEKKKIIKKKHFLYLKGKKFVSDNKDTVNEDEEGYVTEEDEIEADRRTRSNRRVRISIYKMILIKTMTYIY